MKTLVSSIEFCGGSIKVTLNNGKEINVKLHTKTETIVSSSEKKLNKREIELAETAGNACLSYLTKQAPESMSTTECIFAEELAKNFDWEAAGYDPKGSKEDKYITLCNALSHFEDI